MSKTLSECIHEMVEQCKGTPAEESAKRVEKALDAGYCLYNPYPEEDLD